LVVAKVYTPNAIAKVYVDRCVHCGHLNFF